MGLEGVYWVHLAQDRDAVARSCESGNGPSSSINLGDFVGS